MKKFTIAVLAVIWFFVWFSIGRAESEELPVKYSLFEVSDRDDSGKALVVFEIRYDGTIYGSDGRYIGKLTPDERERVLKVFEPYGFLRGVIE